MELLKIVYAAALGQGALIIVMLLTAIKSNIKANLFLLILVLMMMKSILIGYADLLQWDTTLLRQWGIFPLFLHGPVIYCYCVLMTQKKKLSWGLIAHFSWLLFPYIWISFAMYESLTGLQLLHVASFLQLNFYYALSLKALYHYSSIIKFNFANIEKYKLRWLLFLVSGLALLMFIDMGSATLTLVMELEPSTLEIPHLLVLEAIYVFAMGVLAAKQPQVVFDQPLVEESRKYERSSLTYQKAELLIEQVKKLMQADSLYLDNQLTLTELAVKVNVSPIHLSQALNENLGKSFYDFVNELRIEKSKQMLNQYSQKEKTILDIAFSVGFNNKTSFNKAFKKYTGLTPSQYRVKSLAAQS